MFEVVVLYRDGSKLSHIFRQESKAREFVRLSMQDKTVVKAVVGEFE